MWMVPVCSLRTVSNATAEAAHRRHVFWAGGQYVFNASVNGTILVKQIYTEQLTPLNGVKHPYPLVFLHGGGMSGTVVMAPVHSPRELSGIRPQTLTIGSNGSTSRMDDEAGRRTFLTKVMRCCWSMPGAPVDPVRKMCPSWALVSRWNRLSWLSPRPSVIKTTIKRNSIPNGRE